MKRFRGRILYEPSGRALETARFIVGDESPVVVCNTAKSCSHMCSYCYCPSFLKIPPEDFHKRVELKDNALEKVVSDLKKIHRNKAFNPKWFYMCFVGDPFVYGRPDLHKTTYKILEMARDYNMNLITLTKGKPQNIEYPAGTKYWYGISLVSHDRKFRMEEEKGSAPYRERIKGLLKMVEKGARGWVSMEPWPTPNISDQNIEYVLEMTDRLAEGNIDKLIFGRWNYDERAQQKGHEQFYIRQAEIVSDWCKDNGIEFKIKDDILKTI